jgi:hypothetical protein
MRNKRLLLQANLQNTIDFVQFEVQPDGQLLALDLLDPKSPSIKKRNKGKRARRLTGQSKAAITRNYIDKYPEQRQQVLDRIRKLNKIDPNLADRYRDSLQSILLQNQSPNNAAKLAERKLGSIAQQARSRKPNSNSRLLAQLEQEVSDAKVARKVGKTLGKIEKVRSPLVKAEPETVREAKGLSKQIKALGQRFKQGASKLSISQFFEGEIKKLSTLPPTLTRREFNREAGKTLALGTTALARLPQEVTELGNYVFNGVVGGNEIEAVFLGTKKAIIDTFQGGLTILAGGQLTPEAKADVENQLTKLSKTYSDLVDKLPDWAKEKYQDVDNYKLSRRSLLTGQWTKGKKVVTIDVDSKTLPDIWDEPLPPSSRLPKPKVKPRSQLALPPGRSLKPDELFGKPKPSITTGKGQLVKSEVSKTIKGTQDLVSKKPFFRRKGVIGLGIAAATGLTGYAAYNKLKNNKTKKRDKTKKDKKTVNIEELTLPKPVNKTNKNTNLTSTKLIVGGVALGGLALANSGSQITREQYSSLSANERKNYKRLKNGFYIRK